MFRCPLEKQLNLKDLKPEKCDNKFGVQVIILYAEGLSEAVSRVFNKFESVLPVNLSE